MRLRAHVATKCLLGTSKPAARPADRESLDPVMQSDPDKH
jgi:hypothetical protein